MSAQTRVGKDSTAFVPFLQKLMDSVMEVRGRWRGFTTSGAEIFSQPNSPKGSMLFLDPDHRLFRRKPSPLHAADLQKSCYTAKMPQEHDLFISSVNSASVCLAFMPSANARLKLAIMPTFSLSRLHCLRRAKAM